jgi:hypothetical protein
MFASAWFPWRLVRQDKARTRARRSAKPSRCGTSLRFEQLEGRRMMASWTAASVKDLIADISAANLAGGSNTITLAPGKTFTLTAVDNTTDGANGLPVIAANNNLTIHGNGDTIARSIASGTPSFRLIDVALGALLTLENATLRGGYAAGVVGGYGGGVANHGTLTLNAVTVTGNVAQGGIQAFSPRGRGGWTTYVCGGGDGGGVWSNGSLALGAGTVISGNQAIGSPGAQITSGAVERTAGKGGGLFVAGGTATLNNVSLSSNTAKGGGGALGSVKSGGDAFGGAIYVAGGTVALSNDTLSSNTAVGGTGGSSSSGTGGKGGSGYGGALYAAGGALYLHSDTISGNSAQSGPGGSPGGCAGSASGGGLYIATAASVSLDTFTLDHTKDNKPDDIYGACALLA